eukprot:gene1674-3234_t
MSAVNRLLLIFSECIELTEEAKTAEKSKIEGIKGNAGKLFKNTYDEFCKLQATVNSLSNDNRTHAELTVLIAEAAFATENYTISKEILQNFLIASPQKDQFYCRAKLLMGQIIDHESAGSHGMDNIQKRKIALSYVMESLDVAMAPENMNRYKFLVYNTSVIFWKIIHQFLRKGHAKHFLNEIQKISNSLEIIDDPDINWRIMYLSATAFILEDEKQTKIATDAIDKAIDHMEKIVIQTCNIEENLLNDIKQSNKESDEILISIRRVENHTDITTNSASSSTSPIKKDLKDKDNKNKDKDKKILTATVPTSPVLPQSILLPITLTENEILKIKEMRSHWEALQERKRTAIKELREIQEIKTIQIEKLTRLHMQKISINPAEGKKSIGGGGVLSKNVRSSVQLQLQLVLSGGIADKDIQSSLLHLIQELESNKDDSNTIETLLDVCRVSWNIGQKELAIRCQETAMSDSKALSPIVRAKLDICLALRIIADIEQDNQSHISSNTTINASSNNNNNTTTLTTTNTTNNNLQQQRLSIRQNEGLKNSKRIEAIKIMERVLGICINRINDASLLEECCILSWNIILPMLQPHLRSYLHTILRLCVTALESISSTSLVLLRSQMYFELAKCEELGDFLIKGRIEMEKALFSDYGALTIDPLALADTPLVGSPGTATANTTAKSSNKRGGGSVVAVVEVKRTDELDPLRPLDHHYQPLLKSLTLRSDVYGATSSTNTAEDIVSGILQQCKENSSRTFQLDAILRAATIMSDIVYNRIDNGNGNGNGTIATPVNTKRKIMPENLIKLAKIHQCTPIIEFGNDNMEKDFNDAGNEEPDPRAMDGIFEFMKIAVGAIEMIINMPNKSSPSGIVDVAVAVDERLVTSMYESLALSYEMKNQIQLAFETAMKGVTHGSVYTRRRLCELVNRLNYTLSLTKVVKVAVAVEPVKIDHPMLMVLGTLFIAELKDVPIEQKRVLSSKALTLLETDVKTMIAALDQSNMSTDEFNQIAELQAECWTRLTRIRIHLNDIHGAQQSAEKCMQLVTNDLIISSNDKLKLSTRVWRWISVCERYFGIAISHLLKSDGQDKNLQNELRLAALRHFSLAVQFGQKADLEDLILAAAKRAWDISSALISVSVPTIRTSLYHLQKQIVDIICNCHDELAGLLLQQFYMAIIEVQIQEYKWDVAMQSVLEAFERVPQPLQKPLWKWRVIVLSKKGKNVLDGLQKLKETDASLQARVYAIVARSASKPKQQLEAYYKAIHLLNDNLNRLEYMLEMSQWICSNGLPKVEAYDLLQGCIDAIYEVQDRIDNSTAIDDDNDDNASRNGSTYSSQSKISKLSKQQSKSSRKLTASGTIGAGGVAVMRNMSSGSGSFRSVASLAQSTNSAMRRIKRQKSTKSSIMIEPDDPGQMSLNFKHLDMATRSVIMLALLESNTEKRLERCFESLEFINQSMNLWSTTLENTYKTSQYNQQSIAIREQMTLEDFEVQIPDSLIFPQDPIELLIWIPTDTFIEIMKICTELNALFDIPTQFSIICVPLTIYYLLWLANTLYELGYIKSSLTVLAWIRLILFCIDIQNREYVLCVVHYKSLKILHSCGLSDIAIKLPSMLGNKIFGIECWTPIMNGIDRISCSLDICEELISLNMSPVSRTALVVIRKECASIGDDRGFIRAVTLLSQTSEYLGRPESIVSQISSARVHMMRAGDVLIMSTQISLLVNSYLNLDQFAMANTLIREAIELIEALVTISIPAKEGFVPHENLIAAGGGGNGNGGGNGGVGGGGVNNKNDMNISKLKRDFSAASGLVSQLSLQSQSQSQYPSQSQLLPSTTTAVIKIDENKQKQKFSSSLKNIDINNINIENYEKSYENTVGLTTLTLSYVKLLLYEIVQTLSREEDPRVLIAEIHRIFTTKYDIIENILGSNSIVCAFLLYEKSKAMLQILHMIHVEESLLLQLQSYTPWMEANVTICIQEMQKAADILRGIRSSIPNNQRMHSTSNSSTSNSNTTTTDDTSHNNNHNHDNNSSNQLLFPYDNKLATILHDIAIEYVFLTTIRREDVSIYDGSRDEKQSVIDHYLDGTRARNALVLSDFITPSANKSIQCSSAASRLLHGTEYSVDSCVYELVSSIQILNRSGQLDVIWATGSIADKFRIDIEKGKSTLPINIIKSQIELNILFKQSLSTRRYEAAAEASLSLVYTYGRTLSNHAVFALIHYQSIRVRTWLQTVWMNALSPTCSIALALERLRKIENDRIPGFLTQQAIALDTAMLQSNICWKRLDVSRKPQDILSQTAGYCFLGLQFCPRYTTLFVYAGYDASSSSSGGEEIWMVDKIHLFESSRRVIQTLRKQRKEWTDDVMKFVASYGDSYSAAMDEDGSDSLHTDRNMKRTEQSLMDRLHAMITDMEHLIQPILGKDSLIYNCISKMSTVLPSNTTLMMIIDPFLQELPWEGIEAVSSAFNGRTCREFSLHLLGHRLDIVPKTIINSAISTSGGGSGSGSGSGTTVPISVPIVHAAAVQCVIDPLKEDKGNKVIKFQREAMNKSFQSLRNVINGGLKWTVVDTIGTVSLQDWVQISQAYNKPRTSIPANASTNTTSTTPTVLSSTLFYTAPGRLGSLLNPRDLAVLNMSSISLVIIVDLSHNDASYRRQTSSDIQKRSKDIITEDASHLAALLSLTGVSSIVSQQWSTTFSSQQRFISTFWEMFANRRGDAANTVVKSVSTGAFLAPPPNTSGNMNTAPTTVQVVSPTKGNKKSQQHASKAESAAATAAAVIVPVVLDTNELIKENEMMGDLHLKPVKKWIALSRVAYGLPNICYIE